MANREHRGVVTGLADLVSFLVVARQQITALPNERHSIVATLFGPSGSLPKELQSEFLSITQSAFPNIVASVHDPVSADAGEFPINLTARGANISSRTVYGNLIHKPLFQKYFATLRPDAFVFFDNGLSSYWEHDADIGADFSALDLPFPALASLPLSPPLAIPTYLSAIPSWRPTRDHFHEAFTTMRQVAPAKVSPGVSIIVLGSSIFRTNVLRWEEERDLYRRLIEQLRGRGPILFKAHPRAAARPLITEADGVDVLETTMPIEALIEPGHVGAVFGMASTALLTMPKFLGWRAYRLDTPETHRSAVKLPHQRLMDIVDTWPSS